MYPVSKEYLEKIKENVRTFQAKIQIQHSQGVLELDDKDLAQGSLTYTESSQVGEEFTVGGTVASDISFTILNKPEYENINFIGATVTCNIGLLIETMNDSENYFLQGNYPSEVQMEGSERWEWVPLGRFNIDIADRQRSTIQIKAIDNMINLDKSYRLSKLSYPATLYQIYVNICNVADIPVGTTNFPNEDYVVKVRPDDDLTLRDVLGYVAELSGTFAKCNRNGALELKWYTPTDIILEPMNRFNFKPSDDVIQIKGIIATVEDKTYLAGSEDYAIDLTENPLLQGNYETVLPNILANVENTIFTPYTSDWQGNPAIQAGDMIKQIDRDGKEYDTLVTKSIYKYRGRSVLEGRGLPEISRGYKGSTNRKIAEIKRKIDVEVGNKLTTLEEQILQSTELIANMLGGYAFYEADAFYVADHPDLTQAIRVWKWGIGGFGYSENGVDGPYTTAITADGSIVAMLVAANIITADMVQTGILQSEIGNSFFDLNNGILRISHGGTEYSQMDINGFSKRYQYGEAEYLNDLYIDRFQLLKPLEGQYENTVRITLPQSFRGRKDIRYFVVLDDIYYNHTGNVSDGVVSQVPLTIQTYATIKNISQDSSPPYVDVRGASYVIARDINNITRTYYNAVNFFLIAIGGGSI